MTGFGLPDRIYPGFTRVQLSCEAVMAGETLRVTMVVAPEAYDDPSARKVMEESLRRGLMNAILEKWTPVIRVRR